MLNENVELSVISKVAKMTRHLPLRGVAESYARYLLRPLQTSVASIYRYIHD